MKKILIVALCLLAFTACSDDNEEAAKAVYRKLIEGEWYSLTYQKGQTENIRLITPPTEDDPFGVAPIDTYDSFGLRLVFDVNGTGTWSQYFFKGEELINFAGVFYAHFDYTVDADGNITITQSDIDDSGSTLPALTKMRYEEAGFILAEIDSTALLFERPSTRQQDKFVEWQAILDKYHIGADEDDGTMTTDVDSESANEPSRLRRK